MSIYLNYNNLAVKGDVTAKGWENWIELHSFQWGVARGISSPTGSNKDREASAPSISEIVVTKNQDLSTGKLLTEAYQGRGAKVVIDFVKTDQGQLAKYLTFELEDTLISGYSISSGGDRPSESVSLSFNTVNVTPQVVDKDGKITSADAVKYDIGQGKVV